jgi:hypothetical protein
VKDAVNDNGTQIKAAPDASEVATCLGMSFIPACGGDVVLRSRKLSRNPDEKTWYYRHRRGESPRCSRRSGPGWR